MGKALNLNQSTEYKYIDHYIISESNNAVMEIAYFTTDDNFLIF